MVRSSWNIRKVDSSFAQELVRLWITTFHKAYSDKHSTENLKAYTDREYTIKSAEKMLNDKLYDCVVAFQDDIAVGFYVIKHHSCPAKDGEAAELKQIYVFPDQFGTGLGQVLLEHSCERARNDGGKFMWLVVVDINERARSFYFKQGFEEICEGPILEIGTDHITSKLMIKAL